MYLKVQCRCNCAVVWLLMGLCFLSVTTKVTFHNPGHELIHMSAVQSSQLVPFVGNTAGAIFEEPQTLRTFPVMGLIGSVNHKASFNGGLGVTTTRLVG